MPPGGTTASRGASRATKGSAARRPALGVGRVAGKDGKPHRLAAVPLFKLRRSGSLSLLDIAAIIKENGWIWYLTDEHLSLPSYPETPWIRIT